MKLPQAVKTWTRLLCGSPLRHRHATPTHLTTTTTTTAAAAAAGAVAVTATTKTMTALRTKEMHSQVPTCSNHKWPRVVICIGL